MVLLLMGVAAIAGAATLASRYGVEASRGATVGAVFFVTATLIYKTLRALIYPFWFSPLRHVPTPEGGNFLTGHMLKLYTASSPYEYVIPWGRRWPEAPFIRHFGWGNAEVLLPNNLQAIKGVMNTHAYIFDKSEYMKTVFKEFLKGGLLFAMGDDHKRLRKNISGPISRANVRSFFNQFQICAEDMSEKLRRCIYGPQGGVIEVEELFSEVGLDAIGLTVMGKRLSTFTSRTAGLTFEQCYREFLYPSAVGKFILFFNSLIPLRWIPIEANRKYYEADREIRSMLTDLVQERLAEVMTKEKSGGEIDDGADILTKMIQANRAENQLMSDEELLDVLVQLVMGGHETTSASMAFAMHEFVRRPDVTTRMREELAQAREKQPKLDPLMIEGLPYLNNVLRELLRLYPPATTLQWTPIKDIVIEGVSIPKGTAVHVMAAMIHRNRLIWGEDADEFDPDRWDRLTEISGSVSAWQPFINGPRICPGAAFAMLQLKVLIIELLDHFEFELADPNTVVTIDHPTITLKIKGGLRIRFRPRLQ